jgi:hypothetical protein
MKYFGKKQPQEVVKNKYHREVLDDIVAKENKDASPLSNALFLHFQKWNPEYLEQN